MTTRELLWPGAFNCTHNRWVPWPHLFSADDASIFSPQVFLGGVWILVHILESLSIPHESAKPFYKRTSSHKEIAHNVNGEPIEHHKNGKERRVNTELNKI
jgi:hypothetical protein